MVGFKLIVDRETANALISNNMTFPIKMKLIDGLAYLGEDKRVRGHPTIEIFQIERVEPINEVSDKFKVIAYGRTIEN